MKKRSKKMYFLLFLIPIIITIIFFVLLYPTNYEIITKEIHQSGDSEIYTILVMKNRNDEFIYENIEVTPYNYYNYIRGKISSREYRNIKKGVEKIDSK